MRLYQERLCVGSGPLYPSNEMMFVVPLLIGLPQRLLELHRNNFNAFSVILGLNCSALGSISRANLVNQTVRGSSTDGNLRQTLTCSVAGGSATIT